MSEITVSIFIFVVIFAFLSMVFAASHISIVNVASGIIATILLNLLSKLSINGMVVYRVGDITSTDTITTTTIPIINMPMSYIFLSLAIVALGITVKDICFEIKYRLEPDLEGELDI